MRPPLILPRFFLICTAGLSLLLSPQALPAASSPTQPNAATPIDIGAARIDITPAYPVRLTGYAARKSPASPGGLRIFARALAIGSDRGRGRPALLLSVDNCGVGQNVRQTVIDRLAHRTRINPAHIAIASSHTHSAPQTVGFAEFIFVEDLPSDQTAAIERYTQELTDKLEQVALAALADRQPGSLSWSTGQVGFAANRRTAGGPVDHTLPVLCARTADGRIRAVVANYACHCTTIGGGFNQTCGDWAGFAATALERDLPGATALITIGCGADANPSPRGGDDFGIALARRHGETLATETTRLLMAPMTGLKHRPDCRIRRIELPYQTHFTRAHWQQRATNSGIVGFHARKHLERLDRGEPLPPTLPYDIQVWRFGDQLAMVFLNGEVVVDYALRLQRELDGSRLWLTAYANHVPCYIPSRRILAEGGYEAVDSLWYYGRPQQLAPATEDLIIDTVKRLLPNLRNNNPTARP